MSENIEKTEKQEKGTRRVRTGKPHGAEEKCRAVLSLWAGHRKPGELCREYSITYALLSLWERRAMEGMLQALEPRVNLERGPALSPRLQALLEKKRRMDTGRLEERLARIQEKKEPQKEV